MNEKMIVKTREMKGNQTHVEAEVEGEGTAAPHILEILGDNEDEEEETYILIRDSG